MAARKKHCIKLARSGRAAVTANTLAVRVRVTANQLTTEAVMALAAFPTLKRLNLMRSSLVGAVEAPEYALHHEILKLLQEGRPRRVRSQLLHAGTDG